MSGLPPMASTYVIWTDDTESQRRWYLCDAEEDREMFWGLSVKRAVRYRSRAEATRIAAMVRKTSGGRTRALFVEEIPEGRR